MSEPTYLQISKTKRALFVAILVLVAGLGLALFSEGAVRLRHWVKHGDLWNLDQAFTVDPTTGLAIPVANAVVGNVRINSLGFRSPELERPKPATMVRLAFLGASTTFCGEASSNEATWPHLVWQQLRLSWPDASFDYINAGVPGYGLEHVLKNFEARVRPLQPDIIVIYEATNDLSGDTREAARRQGLYAGTRGRQESWLAKHSLLWLLIEKNLIIKKLQAQASGDGPRLHYDPRELSQGFAERLRALIHASQEVAPVVAVATFAPRLRRGQSKEEQIRASTTSLYYMPYMSLEGLVSGFEEYNRVIRVIGTETGVVLIGGEDRIPADDEHYNDSVHFKDPGSRAMATRVTEALLASDSVRALVAAKTGRQIR